MKGKVISGEFGKIAVRLKKDADVEIGELLISETDNKKILLQVYDLSYGSQISQINLELMAGMKLEEDNSLELWDEHLRVYNMALLKNLLVIDNNYANVAKVLPSFFSDVREVRNDDMYFLSYPKKPLHLGKLRSGSKVLEVPIHVEADKVLSEHILIPATTGRGKSNLTSCMLWDMTGKDYCASLVLDPHDEYYGRNTLGLKDHPKKEKPEKPKKVEKKATPVVAKPVKPKPAKPKPRPAPKPIKKKAKKKAPEEDDDSTFSKVIIFAGIVCILLLLVLVKVFTEEDQDKAIERDLANANGYVEIEMYIDYSCKHSLNAWENMLQLKDIYREHLGIKVKHYPLSPDDIRIGNAVHCARKENKHMGYVDRILNEQNGLDDNNLKNFAWAEGIEGTALLDFHKCVDEMENKEKIKEEFQEGYAKGVRSTPTFFIDGEMVTGSQSISYFQNIIDEKLGLD